ncbi:DoxX family membrane protein [Naumannella sp. ID2617S]|nr:DoxX family membrane protein [Naumannella sp. ID2617S]
MTLTRALARTMLAGYFVYNGAKALKDPSPYLEGQEKFARTVVPLAKKVAPAEVATAIPTDASTLARISGGLQVAGGLAMVLGKGRRLGAGLVAASMVPQLLSSGPGQGATSEQKAAARDGLLKNLALIGGALIVAQDTEGQPSLAWRAQDQASRISRKVEKAKAQLEKDVDVNKRQARKQLKQARKAARKQVKELTADRG